MDRLSRQSIARLSSWFSFGGSIKGEINARMLAAGMQCFKTICKVPDPTWKSNGTCCRASRRQAPGFMLV